MFLFPLLTRDSGDVYKMSTMNTLKDQKLFSTKSVGQSLLVPALHNTTLKTARSFKNIFKQLKIFLNLCMQQVVMIILFVPKYPENDSLEEMLTMT